MSKWNDLYNIGKGDFSQKIKEMNTVELLNAVDEIIQIDMLHLSSDTWIDDPKYAAYHRCIHELRRKIKKNNTL